MEDAKQWREVPLKSCLLLTGIKISFNKIQQKVGSMLLQIPCKILQAYTRDSNESPDPPSYKVLTV